MERRLEVRVCPHLCQHNNKNIWVTELKIILFHDPIFQKTSHKYLDNTSPASDIKPFGIYREFSCIWITVGLITWSVNLNLSVSLWNLCTFNLLCLWVPWFKLLITGKKNAIIHFMIYRPLPFWLCFLMVKCNF